MNKPSIFVGSSKEQLDIAEAIELNLEAVAEVTCWKHMFTPGRPFLHDLVLAKDDYDFAIFVLTPDDVLFSRDKKYSAPRDNVVFEMGLFIGSIGPERVYALCDANVNAKILSDYVGVTFLTYDSQRSDERMSAAVSPACTQVKQLIKKLGGRESKNSQTAIETFRPDLFGLIKTYPTYVVAEEDILADLRNSTGPVRLFLQVATQNIGNKGTIYDVLNEVDSKQSVEIRILHASEKSPLFARDRLLSISKDPDAIHESLRYVDRSLSSLARRLGSSLLHRGHEWPFFWRLYGFERRLYMMPYFAVKDAFRGSPVLLFEKRPNSLYSTFVDLFDFVWGQCAPRSTRIRDLVTRATPAGTAIFCKWEGFHVFGIPKRDLRHESEFVRFYGIGGKRRDPDESWEECALREGNEETENSIREIRGSSTTQFFRANGTIEDIGITREAKRPRLILEKRIHSGYGAMDKQADNYYLIAFDAILSRKPSPSRELAAILFLKNRHLSLIRRRNDTTLGDLLKRGAEVSVQEGVQLDLGKMIVPHGTALYLMRQIPG